MSTLRLRLFGLPHFEASGREVAFGRRRALALIAYLAVTRQPQSRDRLLGLLWPDFDPSSARNNLRRELSLLNSLASTPLLAADRQSVAIAPSTSLWIDVEVFRQQLRAAGHGQGPLRVREPAQAANVAAAAELYRDDFLAGFYLHDSAPFEEWQFLEMEAFRQQYADTLETLVTWYGEQRDYTHAVDYARRWVATDPLHEPAQRALMHLYAMDGRHAAAQRQYEQLAELLQEELGAQPDEETETLYQQIKRRRLPNTHGEGEQSQGRLRPIPVTHNLPDHQTPLIGREDELAALDSLLENEAIRLITITGQSGVGKTRLANVIARQQVGRPGRFPDGIFFVPLAAVAHSSDVVYALASAIRLPLEGIGRPLRQQLLDYLAEKSMLLVLDGCDRRLPGTEFIQTLLHRAPGVRLICTANVELKLKEERLVPLSGLTYPTDLASTQGPGEVAGYAAVRLFVNRVQRTFPSFALSDEISEHVFRICQHTEGLPLALELSAALTGTMQVAEIAARIQESLDAPEKEPPATAQSQRAMRAVFEASWKQLAQDEQVVLAQLAIFRGDFARDAVLGIVVAADNSPASLLTLAELTNRSLLRYDGKRHRYMIHDILRRYAAEKLASWPTLNIQVRDAHCRAFCGAMRRWLSEIEGAHKPEALHAIDEDFENILLAWEWAVEQTQVEQIDQALRTLEHYAYWRNRFQTAIDLFRTAATQLDDKEGGESLASKRRFIRACLLARQGYFSFLLNDARAAASLYSTSRELLEQEARAGRDVRSELAYVAMKMGDLPANTEAARQHFMESLALYQAVGHRWGSATAASYLGFVALANGAWDEAEQHLQLAHAMYRRIGDRWQCGWVLDGLSRAALQRDALDDALRCAEESVAIFREIGVRGRIANSLVSLSWIHVARGDQARAQELYREALTIWRDLGKTIDVANPDHPEAPPGQPQWFTQLVARRRAAAARVAEAVSSVTEERADARLQPPAHAAAPVVAAPLPVASDERGWPARTLPTPATAFVGREHELADLTSLLHMPDCRLLTILGIGGIGKTRLAIEVARSMEAEFPDGAIFIPLQALSAADQVPVALAEALDLTLGGWTEPWQLFANALRDRQLLLLFDSFEHLLDAADLLALILSHTRKVKCLVTTRQVLGLQEEWIYPLEGLLLPEQSDAPSSQQQLLTADAVRLFTLRAQHVQRGFNLAQEVKSVARICALVEGMPLAIELAAAWTRTLSCAEIGDAIQHDLDFLTTNLRNVPERHRSMRAALDTSWRQLTSSERAVFQQLTVCRGGFRQEAAETITGATLAQLATLVDKSMLRRDADGRYHVHELLRQYGEEQLTRSADEAAVRGAHAAYYINLLNQLHHEMKHGEQRRALDIIDVDYDNIRTAWAYAVQDGTVERIELAADTLTYYFQMSSHFREAAELFTHTLERIEQRDLAGQYRTLRAQLACYKGWFYLRLGQFERAEATFLAGHNLYTEIGIPHLPLSSADPRIGLGIVANARGDYSAAEKWGEEARRINESLNDQANLADSYYVLTNSAYGQGKYQRALRFAERARSMLEEIGDRWMLGHVLNDMGNIACALGNYGQARRYYQRSLALYRSFRDREGTANALRLLARTAGLERAYDEAIRLYEESLGLYRQISDMGGLAATLGGLAKVRWASNQPQTAVEAYSEALRRAREISYLPLTLSLLVEVGAVFLEAGHRERGAEYLAVAFYHPASGQEVRDRAKGILEQYNLRLAQPQVAKAIDLTEPAAFAEVMGTLPAELNEAVAHYRSNEAPVVS